jgi:hypothetical protein
VVFCSSSSTPAERGSRRKAPTRPSALEAGTRSGGPGGLVAVGLLQGAGEQDVAVHHAREQSPLLLVASELCDRQGAQDQGRDCGHGGDRATHFFQQHAGGEEAHVAAAELLGYAHAE